MKPQPKINISKSKLCTSLDAVQSASFSFFLGLAWEGFGAFVFGLVFLGSGGRKLVKDSGVGELTSNCDFGAACHGGNFETEQWVQAHGMSFAQVLLGSYAWKQKNFVMPG